MFSYVKVETDSEDNETPKGSLVDQDHESISYTLVQKQRSWIYVISRSPR